MAKAAQRAKTTGGITPAVQKDELAKICLAKFFDMDLNAYGGKNSNFNKDLLAKVMNYEGTAGGFLQDITQMLSSSFMEMLLQGELDAYLGYDKYARRDTPADTSESASEGLSEARTAVSEGEPEATSENDSTGDERASETSGKRMYRNGSYPRKLRTQHGEVTVDFPRTRNGDFTSAIMPKNKHVDLCDLHEKIYTLIAAGSSEREASRIITEMFQTNVSPQYVQMTIDAYKERLKSWQNRTLQPFYPFVFIDCMYLPVRDDSGIVDNRAVYVILGIDMDGHKDILHIEITGKKESKSDWMKIFARLQQRGLQDLLFVCMDGINGVADGISVLFSNCIVQRCVVHLLRNSCKFVSYKDRKEWCNDCKKIYNAIDYETGKLELAAVTEKWTDRIPAAVRHIQNNFDTHIKQLYEFPMQIRKIIYTTNAIESVNSSMRTVVKKGCYKNANHILSAMLLRYEKMLQPMWAKKAVPNWHRVLNILLSDERTAEVMAKYA